MQNRLIIIINSIDKLNIQLQVSDAACIFSKLFKKKKLKTKIQML